MLAARSVHPYGSVAAVRPHNVRIFRLTRLGEGGRASTLDSSPDWVEPNEQLRESPGRRSIFPKPQGYANLPSVRIGCWLRPRFGRKLDGSTAPVAQGGEESRRRS